MSCANPSSSTSSGGSGGNGSGGGGSGCGGGGGPCGACKFLRRKCVAGCVFAAYFDSEQGAAHFAAVHKVFGASNVSKLLLHIPPHRRHDAVVTICYEAQARLRDPVYGCVAHIFALQHQVVNLQTELSYLQAHLATLELPSPPPPPPPPAPTTEDVPPPLSISDLPPASTLPAATYDLSSLFDPTLLQPAWATLPQRQMDPHPPRHAQYLSSSENLRRATDAPAAAGCGNLQELARELFHRHGSPISPPPAHGPPMSHEPQ